MSIIIYVDTVYSESLRGWGEGERGEGGRGGWERESNNCYLFLHTHLSPPFSLDSPSLFEELIIKA